MTNIQDSNYEIQLQETLNAAVKTITGRAVNERKVLSMHKPLNAESSDSLILHTNFLKQILQLDHEGLHTYVIIDNLNKLQYLFSERGELTKENFYNYITVVKAYYDNDNKGVLHVYEDNHSSSKSVKVYPDDDEYPKALLDTPKWQFPWHLILSWSDIVTEYERRCVKYQGNMLYKGTLLLGEALKNVNLQESEWEQAYLADPFKFGPEKYVNEYKVNIPFKDSDTCIEAKVSTSRINGLATISFSTWNYVALNVKGVKGLLNSFSSKGDILSIPCEYVDIDETIMRGPDTYNHILSIQVNSWY